MARRLTPPPPGAPLLWPGGERRLVFELDDCSVCDRPIPDLDDVVECLDWPGRNHHRDCKDGCVECRNALADERRGT